MLRIRSFTEPEARRVASWRYEPPYDVYDGDAGNVEAFLRPTGGVHAHFAVVDSRAEDDLVGHCCFKAEARVAGQV
ncbi:MAG: hypothetical protein H0U89_07725, partial [Acidimicrobiia bacterium]|nr:hypothetical protein [Acidimicrobiia bacterium]